MCKHIVKKKKKKIFKFQFMTFNVSGFEKSVGEIVSKQFRNEVLMRHRFKTLNISVRYKHSLITINKCLKNLESKKKT